MKICYVAEKYIDFLKEYDTKVPFNKNQTRPYVGILLCVDGINYYAPLTSPKPKHRQMSNTKDFRLICGGKLGAINFNNMIPVPDHCVIDFNIEDINDTFYRDLLRDQTKAISDDWNSITKTAENLRKLVLAPDSRLSKQQKIVKSRCCDFALLEKIMQQYLNKEKRKENHRYLDDMER